MAPRGLTQGAGVTSGVAYPLLCRDSPRAKSKRHPPADIAEHSDRVGLRVVDDVVQIAHSMVPHPVGLEDDLPLGLRVCRYAGIGGCAGMPVRRDWRVYRHAGIAVNPQIAATNWRLDQPQQASAPAHHTGENSKGRGHTEVRGSRVAPQPRHGG